MDWIPGCIEDHIVLLLAGAGLNLYQGLVVAALGTQTEAGPFHRTDQPAAAGVALSPAAQE